METCFGMRAGFMGLIFKPTSIINSLSVLNIYGEYEDVRMKLSHTNIGGQFSE